MNDARFRSDAETIAKELGGLRARRAGDQWMTLCPAHDDENASLAVKDRVGGGNPLVHCHAGCHQDAVIDELVPLGLWGRPYRTIGPEQTEAARKRKEEQSKKLVEAQGRITETLDRSTAADSSHPYLIEKGIKPNGAQRDGNRLVVPVRDIEGKLQSLQFISPNGDKQFHPNASAKGGMYILGGAEGAEALCICTGFATGASIHEAVGLPVVVAFSDGNLGPVTKALRRKWPDLPMVVCADDDYTDPRNPGLTKAKEAAQAIKAAVAVPDFGSRRPKDIAAGQRSKEQGKDYSDFNDLQREWGLEAVKRQIEPVIKAANEPVYRPDPLEDLVIHTEADPGAPFAPDVLEALVTLRQEDKSRFETLRAQLKRAGCRVTELDNEMIRERTQSGKKREDDSFLEEVLTNGEIKLFLSEGAEEAFADVEINSHCESLTVHGAAFKRWLVTRYRRSTGKSASTSNLEEVLREIDAAAHEGPRRSVFNRVGSCEGKVYIDLGNRDWNAIEIDSSGWRIIEIPSARFQRTKGISPLPEPLQIAIEEGKRAIEELRRFINVKSDADFRLVIAWVLGSLRGQGPYSVLVLSGEQGAAKSTSARILRALVDPNVAPLRSLPRDERDLFISAANTHVLAFDNISCLSEWLSDALCRIASGGGSSTRTLYTDREETLFNVSRPVLLNGIENVMHRPDLADRSIHVELEAIPNDKRRFEAELWEAFSAERPRILGGLLNAVSVGLGRLPETQLSSTPRMADFVRWIVACEPALWTPGTFEEVYGANRDHVNEDMLEADPVAIAIMDLMSGKDLWEGTATELLAKLTSGTDEKIATSKVWPKSGRALSERIKRLKPALRAGGLEVGSRRTGKRRIIQMRVTQTSIVTQG